MSTFHLSSYGSNTRCCYRGCGDSRNKNKGLRLFQFPLKNMATWFKHIGNPTMSGVTKENLEKRNLRVCEKHFRPEDILPSGRLMHGALPVPFQGELDYQEEGAKAHEEESSRDLDVFKTSQPKSYGKSSVIESMLAVTLDEQTDPPSSDSLPRVDSDVASQLDFNAMSSAMSRARKSANTTEVETQEVAGPSNIEIRPCSSKSSIQFVPSEITTLQDLEFGTLEESGMGQFTPTPLEEESRGAAIEKKGKEMQASANSLGDETQATPSATVVSDDVVVISSVDVSKPSVNKSGNVVQPSVNKSVNVSQPSVNKSVNVSQPLATKLHTQTKSAKAQERVSSIQVDAENAKLDINAKKLESAIDRLESVSNKFIAASLADKYDQFGKYISSLLRGLPSRKVNSLKKKLVSQVLEALYEEEKEPSTTMKTIGTQVALDGLASVAPFRSLLKEQDKGVSSVSTDARTLANNIPILGGNMPILFPGASSSSSFQLLPVIPMSTASMVSAATVVSTPSLANPVMSAPPVPLTPCETVTTVAKSADGTLLAVTIPKPQMTEALVGTDTCALHPQRGQKRKQTTAAYLIKKCTRIAPKAIDNSSLDSQTVSQTDGGTQTESELQSQESSRDSGGGDFSSSSDQPVRQTEGSSQSEENSRDTGGGDGLNIINQPMKSEVQTEHQEFEMDIEEGNELAQMKQDQELFETVMCGEGSTSDIYIKEEAPDPEENPPPSPPPPPLPPSPPSPAKRPSTAFECPLCNAQCSYRDELVRHLATAHSGKLQSQKGSGSQTHAEHSAEDKISNKPVKGIETSEYVSSACFIPLQSCPRNSDNDNESVECSASKKQLSILFKKLPIDQLYDKNAVPSGSSLLPESSTQFSSAPKVPNVNSSFAFINYNPTDDQSIINYVKSCLSKSKQFSSNELGPVARIIKESNDICDGYYPTGTGKLCDCEDQNTMDNISLCTSLNRKDISDPSISGKYDIGGNAFCYGNYSSDEHYLKDDSIKGILKLTEMQDEDLVPSSETNELGNMTISSKKGKRIRRKDFCFYCKEWVYTFARHVVRHHEHESEVKKVMSKVIGSRERKDLLTILRKKGNYIASISGVKRAVKKSKRSDSKLLPCTYCLGFYSRLQLWRHRKICILGPRTKNVPRKLARSRENWSPTDMPAEFLSVAMEQMEKRENLRKPKRDLSYVEEELDREMSDKDVDDKTATLASLVSLNPSTSSFTGIQFNSKFIGKKKKRHFTKWTTEEKAAVSEYFKKHVEESKPPRKKECELLMRTNKTLFQDKTWLKIKVFVQNLYTKKNKTLRSIKKFVS